MGMASSGAGCLMAQSAPKDLKCRQNRLKGDLCLGFWGCAIGFTGKALGFGVLFWRLGTLASHVRSIRSRK